MAEEMENLSDDQLFDLIFSTEKYENSPMLLKDMQCDELMDIMTNVSLKQLKPKKSYRAEVLLNATYQNLREEWDNKLQIKRKAEELEMCAAKKMKYETGETSKNDQVDVCNKKREQIKDNSGILELGGHINQIKKPFDVNDVKDNEKGSNTLKKCESLEQTKKEE